MGPSSSFHLLHERKRQSKSVEQLSLTEQESQQIEEITRGSCSSRVSYLQLELLIMKKINLILLYLSGIISFINAQIPLAEIEGNTYVNGMLGIGTDNPFHDLHIKNTDNSTLAIDGNSTSTMWLKRNNSNRWAVFRNNTAESGMATGSDFLINRFSNTGAFLGTALFLQRSTGNVGVGIGNPVEKLEVAGGIRLEGASSDTPDAGTIRWNEDTQDFEGFNGTAWLSLTERCSSTGSMNTGPPVPPMCCEESYAFMQGGEDDQFGQDVAIYGNYSLASQRTDSVHILQFDGNNWVQDTILNIQFGQLPVFVFSLDLDSNYAIIGAGSVDLQTGRIISYEKFGGQWNAQDTLWASDADVDDQFGNSVGISGAYLVSGAPYSEYDGDLNRRKVYFFQLISGSWTEVAKLSYSDGNSDDLLGSSVDISGIYAVAGAPAHNSYGDAGRGIGVVYERNGNVWGESDTLHMPSGTSSAAFGTSVSIDGDYVVVGAPGAVSNAGRAYIFKRNGTAWELEEMLQAPDGVAGDRFGTSVSISGDYVIVGAPNNDVDGKMNQGAAYVFSYNGTIWEERGKLTDQVGQSDDRYGFSVSTDSANRLVGAPFADANGDSDRGKIIFGPVE